MAEVITLSSGEEDDDKIQTPSKKKIKLITLTTSTEFPIKYTPPAKEPACIVLSDEEECDNSIVPSTPKTKPMENEEREIKILLQNLENATNGVDFDLPTSSSRAGQEDELNNFLDTCLRLIINPEHKELLVKKLPIIRKLYKKLSSLEQNYAEGFSSILETNLKNVEGTPEQTVIFFNDVYLWLKSSYREALKSPMISEHNQRIIMKLDKVLIKIRRRIRQLEQTEIEFDDEENSAFMQTSRYMERATKLYEKFAKYHDENPHYGRSMYSRLDFSASQYTEINRAINKKYRNNSLFPTFYDIDHLIRECVKKNKIKMTEDELKIEIKACFELLGKLLQRRRKFELLDNQMGYILGTSDPANLDPSIDTTIRNNRKSTEKALDEICEKYTRLQEKNVNPEVSSESDDSNTAVSGDSECEQNENTSENI